MKVYVTLRDWIDELWRQPGQQVKGTLVPAFLPVVLVCLFARNSQTLWLVSGTWTLAFVSFVVWRGLRDFRSRAETSDEQYDRVGKFSLPADYHSTRSATASRKAKS